MAKVVKSVLSSSSSTRSTCANAARRDDISENKQCQFGTPTLRGACVVTAAGLTVAALTVSPDSRPAGCRLAAFRLVGEPLHDVAGIFEILGDDGAGDLLLLELGQLGDTDGRGLDQTERSTPNSGSVGPRKTATTSPVVPGVVATKY